jgi:hypothetical protein
MAKTNTIPNVQNVNDPDGTIVNGTGTGTVDLFTAGANDSIVRAMSAASTDTVDRSLQLSVNIGGSGTDRLVTTILIPANSGNSATIPPVDLFHAVSSSVALMPFLTFDAYGNRVWALPALTKIKGNVTVAVTAAKKIDITGDGANF